MNTSPARSLRASGGSPASARTPVRIARSVVFWSVTVMAAVAALVPIRPESVTASISPAQSSVTFSGYDLAAFQELGIDVQGSVAGTLRVVPVDLAVGEDGSRQEVAFGTTDFSLAQGLRVTPESFDYVPGDIAQRFGFTVVVDPTTIDRTRVAGLRFVFQPQEDGAKVETVTVPVVAVPVVEGYEDADPVGPPAGNVELLSVDVHQDGPWTLVDRLLPDLPSVVGHAPGVATAELFGNTVHIMSGARVEIAYDRLNPLSVLPFVDDDGSTAFRTTVDEGFLLPRESASVSVGSFGRFTQSEPSEALPFIGLVRVTATATRDIAGAEQVVETKSRTIVVVPWTEMLFVVALGGALRRRRRLLVRRDQEAFLREGPRLLLGGRGRRGGVLPAPGVEPEAPVLEPAAFGSATFRPVVVPPLEEVGVGAFREPVVEETHMPVKWDEPAVDLAAMRARQRAAEELAAATAARRAAVGSGLSRAAAGVWPWTVALVTLIGTGVWRGGVAVVNAVTSVTDLFVVRTAKRVPVIARRVGSSFSSGTAALDRRLTASATAVGRGATASTSVAARGFVRFVSSIGAAAINGVSAVVRGVVWVIVTIARGVGAFGRAVFGAISFVFTSAARGVVWIFSTLGRGVAVSAVATSSAVGSGSRDALRAFAHWRRTGGRDLRLRALGYVRATRRGTVTILVLAYDGVWWIGRGTEIGLDLAWKGLRRAAAASARGAAVLGRSGVRVGGAALRGSAGLLRAATSALRASGRAGGAAIRTSAQASARASAAAAQATGHGLTAVGSAVGAGTAVMARTTRERIAAFVSTIGHGIAAFSRATGRTIVSFSRATAHGLVVSARAIGRASLAVARATGRFVVSASRLTARGAVVTAAASSSGASRAWSSYRWWARTNVPAIRRWFSAWGRFLRRNAIVAARGLGRATVTSARGLLTSVSVTARLLGRSVVALGRATIAASSATANGASRAWSAYRVWLRTDYPAIRRWFAAWGRLFRRNAIAFGRVVIAVLAWSGERLDDLFHATAVGVRRLARWWVRTGAPGLAYRSRRLWRQSRHLARVTAIGTARWLAGKRSQSVRGWARTKRWTKATLRFIARVARATWAGPLRWFLRFLLRLAERALKWLDRRNDDLPPLD